MDELRVDLDATRLDQKRHHPISCVCLAPTLQSLNYIISVRGIFPEMKPTVQDEDMEDDLAAEEENKLINEVCFTGIPAQR